MPLLPVILTAASLLTQRSVEVEVWTAPPVVTGGYVSLDLSTAYLSPDLVSALDELVNHSTTKTGVKMEWAGWAVNCLSHEVGHLRGLSNERDAENYGISHVKELLDLMGIHGTVKQIAYLAAKRADATYRASDNWEEL